MKNEWKNDRMCDGAINQSVEINAIAISLEKNLVCEEMGRIGWKIGLHTTHYLKGMCIISF